MSNHTPGPWFAKGRYIGTKNHMSYIGECRDVNGNWSDDAKASADAQLIASAPELLEALKEVFVIGDRLVDDVYGREFVEKAKAAIAKAEGLS